MNIDPEIMAWVEICGMRGIRGVDRLTGVARVTGWVDGRKLVKEVKKEGREERRRKRRINSRGRVKTRNSKTRKL